LRFLSPAAGATTESAICLAVRLFRFQFRKLPSAVTGDRLLHQHEYLCPFGLLPESKAEPEVLLVDVDSDPNCSILVFFKNNPLSTENPNELWVVFYALENVFKTLAEFHPLRQ
jgi:hypothetical protein